MFSPERVKAIRKKRGKTQAELSCETGISRVSISAIENGKKEPRAGTISLLAAALECRVDYFFA